MSVGVCAAVAGVGGLGAVARFLLDGAIGQIAGRSFPSGTLAINLSGAFVLGLLTGLALSGNAFFFYVTATIVFYTTFSTWMLESQRLVEDGELGGAAVNLGCSVIAGVAAAALGRLIGGGL